MTDVDPDPEEIDRFRTAAANTLARNVRFNFQPELSSSLDEEHDTIKGLRLLSDGIPTMPPGRTIPILFDHFVRRGDKHPDCYNVHISYDGPADKPYEDDIVLDLGV